MKYRRGTYENEPMISNSTSPFRAQLISKKENPSISKYDSKLVRHTIGVKARDSSKSPCRASFGGPNNGMKSYQQKRQSI